MTSTTISGAGAHSVARLTDRLPAMGGAATTTNGYLTGALLLALMLDATGIGTATAGLRLNNLTTTQQNAVSGPSAAAGNLIWNSTLAAPTVYDGSAWQQVGMLGVAQSWTAAQTFSGAPIIISGNISSAAWTTSGIRIKGTPGTLTDTTSSGTVATAYTDVLGGNTIAASSATTFTNYFSMYVNAGVAGTNVTLTNKWAIGADSLKVGTSNPLTVSASGVLTATSPVFATPALGVATGTSLALTEAIGASALTLTGATQTSSFPVINATQTWNNSGTTFTGLKLNITSTASAAASLFVDIQLASVSYFSIKKNGQINVGNGGGSGPALNYNGPTLQVVDQVNGAYNCKLGCLQYNMISTGAVGWTSDGDATSTRDLILTRAAAASLQLGAADVNGNAVAQTIQGQSGITGTDKNGANLTLIAGKGSGAGTPGNLVLQVSSKLGTGTTSQTAATGLTVAFGALNMQPSVVVGNQALTTTDTDGFLYIPGGSGAPSGTPTAFTGRYPLYWDHTNKQLYIYDAAWLQPKTPAAAAIVNWQ